MALTKSSSSITTLTATGTSTTVSVASSYRHSCYIRHINGTGTITAGGIARVQCRPQSSTTWYTHLSTVFSQMASATETRVVPLPDDAAEVRIDYVAPVGSTGHSLDVEVGQITSY
mgnify:CR=1 FL=1